MPNLAPQEQDVHTLLRRFLLKVHAGSPLSYATFREAWQELHFSLIYEGCLEHSTLPGFVQTLFAVACDHLQAPLPPAEPSSAAIEAAHPATAAPAEAANIPDELQQPPAAEENRPAAPIRQGALRGRNTASEPVPLHQGQSKQRGRSLASSHDLLAAAVARNAGGAAVPSRPPSRAGNGADMQQQRAAMPRIDSVALRALLLDEGDAEQPAPSQGVPASEGGVNTQRLCASSHQDHIHHLVSSLQALDVPDVELDHAPQIAGRTVSEAGCQDADGAQHASETQNDASSPSLALRVGALYTMYTLHETQPCARRVRPYMSLSSLQIALETMREARRRGVPDVAAVMKRLVKGHALVYGGVLRPPACEPAQPVHRPKVAQVDMRARNAMMPLTVQHLQATQADLRELKHLQLLCDSYRSAQSRVFAAADPEDMPPSITDLNMGLHLNSMLSDLTANVQQVLESGMSGRKPGPKTPRDKGGDVEENDAAPEEPATVPDDEEILTAAVEGVDHEGLEGEIEEDLDLSGLPAAARRVALKQAKERVIMRRKQALWAARGAAALAAASDMPGSPRGERLTTPDHVAAGSDIARKLSGTGIQATVTFDHLGSPLEVSPAGAAAFDAPSAATAEDKVGGAANGEGPRRVPAQLAALGEAPAEEPARAGIERQGNGAAEGPESIAIGSHKQGFPGKRRQAKRREPKRGAEKEIGGVVLASPPTARNRVSRKASTAAGADRAPQPVRNGEAVGGQLRKAAAVEEDAEGPSHAPEESARVEHPSAHEQDGMEGLEYDILGLPVIPNLGKGHGTATTASPLNMLHVGNADQSAFESDVSDNEDVHEAPATPADEPPLDPVSMRPAQLLPEEDAVPSSRPADILGTSEGKGGEPVAEEAWSAGVAGEAGTERGLRKNDSKPASNQPQGKACQGSKGARARPASKPAAAKSPTKLTRQRLEPTGAGPARQLPLSVAGRGEKQRHGTAVRKEPMREATQPRLNGVSSGAVSAEEPDGHAAQETMLPPRKRARSSAVKGAEGGLQREGSGRGPEQGHEEGAAAKQAPMDWEAYAMDMARLAAEAEAVLAEEDDDL
ncbi:g10549 [Coccomyxa elongata]